MKDPSPSSVKEGLYVTEQLSVEVSCKTGNLVVRILTWLWVAFFISVAVWLSCRCRFDPKISFLAAHHSAKWIVEPRPITAAIQPAGPDSTTFRHSLHLEESPASVRLAVRMFRTGALFVNGNRVTLPPSDNWKRALEVNVAPWLKPGDNTLAVIVSNKIAPPGLWLEVTGPGYRLISDDTWQVERADGRFEAARLATKPPPIHAGDLLAGREKGLASLVSYWGRLVLLALLAVGTVIGANFCQRASWSASRESTKLLGATARIVREPGNWLLAWRQDPPFALIAAIVLLWIALVANNHAALSPGAGFDAYGHLEYIQYIQQHGSVPLANQGWEMHQPPLYYLICAALLNVAGLAATSPEGITLLRWISMAIGLVHISIVLGVLRLMFPNQSAKQLVGLLVAGFVPMQLYLAHYPTNEPLAACLMAVTLLLTLRLVCDGPAARGFSAYAALGVYLGLALLAKVTAVVMVPIAMTGLVYATAKSRSVGASRWLFPLCCLALCLAVCGWYYWRVWRHFGQPILPDVHSGVAISAWQGPGYRTDQYFFGFGKTLENPFFSGTSSFADGLYSTLWGDGLCSGAGTLRERPPWNYELMSVGFILALFPSALIVTGFVSRAWKTIRRPEPLWLLVLAFSCSMLLAIFYFNLVAPSYAVAKAFYGLGALGCLCAFAVEGWNVFAATSRRIALVAAIALLTWAMVAYLSFWSISA